MPMTRPTASNSDRYSSAVRASVFDAFYQLGGMEQDSKLAEWMFNDSSVPPGHFQGGALQSPGSGSRFQERFDADNDWEIAEAPPVATPPLMFQEPEPDSRRSRRTSRTPKFFQRIRSKSRTRTREPQRGSPDAHRDPPNTESFAPPSSGMRHFFRRPSSSPASPQKPSHTWSMFRKSSNPHNHAGAMTSSPRSSIDTISPSPSPLRRTVPLGSPINTPDAVPFPTGRRRAPSKGSVNLLDNEAWEHLSTHSDDTIAPHTAVAPGVNPFIQGQLFIPEDSDVHRHRWDLRQLSMSSRGSESRHRRTHSRPEGSQRLALQRSFSHL